MISSWLIITCSLIYVAILFAIAYFFEHRKTSARANTWVYSLSLAVYCTSWAFFGTIQQAAVTGWFFAPTYVGTILLLFFGWRFLRKLVSVSKANNITSIADFIASRYGKSQRLSGTITFIALIALIPYIALQLKALTTSYILMTSGTIGQITQSPSIMSDSAFYITLLMALFSIIFGTRRVDATEHQTGIIYAIAFESVIKLLAFLIMGVYICYYFFDGVVDVANKAQNIASIKTLWQQNYSPLLFWTHALLGLLAIICLPRQFHVLVVENKRINDVKTARWIFSGYLLLINLFILPIALAGLVYFNGMNVSPEMFILGFPLSDNSALFSLVAYIGGFSAATSMIIIVSIVLSTMVSNDIIIPLSVHYQWLRKERTNNVQQWLINIRRLVILCILLLAFVYYRTIATTSELASIGLLSFSLVAQFAPAIFGGLYWKKANKKGVVAGLIFGISIWLYTLLIPALVSAGYISSSILYDGLFSVSWLKPQELFGQSSFDTMTVGVFWSLLLNTLAYLYVSRITHASTLENLQAARFVSPKDLSYREDKLKINDRVTVGDLYELCERFIGSHKTDLFFTEELGIETISNTKSELATSQQIDTCQKRLSRVIGGSSARIVMDSLTGKRAMPLYDLVNIVDEASQMFTFNRELLQSAMENISHGISVIDKDLKLVAWNHQYQSLFNYPDELLTVGRPIADLIRFNAEQGVFGKGNIQQQVNKRLDYLRQASPHTFERYHTGGKVLKIQGNPMPGGGFVTVFIDITELRQKQQELAKINATLEDRVNSRTQELLTINQQLDKAKQTADEANKSKTRFLAAASHDILQPINAASLFTQALLESNDNQEVNSQLEQIKRALHSADELLTDLLDISKFDAGVVTPHIKPFPLQPLLLELYQEFSVIAQQKGVTLKLQPTKAIVKTDAALLRRIIQNFISNAIRYNSHGKVIIGVRKAGKNLQLQVLDNGIGIKQNELESIFNEFTRVDQHSSNTGHGLGLAIVQRCSQLLHLPVKVASTFGKGSCFSITIPVTSYDYQAKSLANTDAEKPLMFDGIHILCVDNDPAILQAMESLLSKWGITCSTFQSLDEVKALPTYNEFDALIVDNHLDNGDTGFDVIHHIHNTHPLPTIIISADRSQALKDSAQNENIPLLYKPVKAIKLRALLNKILSR